MRKLILLFLILLSCNTDKTSPSDQDIMIALALIHASQDNSCVAQYGSISPLGNFYNQNLFSGFPETCENVIIGNSTMDIGRQVSGFYDANKTNNYGIGGNTACDMLLQMEYIRCNPKNVIIASADGNGVLRGVSAETSKNTINQIINKARERWDANIILVGIHPVKIREANIRKNRVNELVRPLPDCFVNMVELFGVGENDLPPDNLMVDNIHYAESVYFLLRDKILNQCGVGL
jgi:hypothetical protein